jgi:hypothetical protein
MTDQQNQALTPEELAAQEAEQLPNREVMTALEPPLPMRPVPIEPLPVEYVPPESA